MKTPISMKYEKCLNNVNILDRGLVIIPNEK